MEFATAHKNVKMCKKNLALHIKLSIMKHDFPCRFFTLEFDLDDLFQIVEFENILYITIIFHIPIYYILKYLHLRFVSTTGPGE